MTRLLFLEVLEPQSRRVVELYKITYSCFFCCGLKQLYGDCCSARTLSSGLIIIGDFPLIISRGTHFPSPTSSHSACNYIHTWEGEAGRNRLTRSTHLFHIYKDSTLWCYISYTHLCTNMFQKFKVQLIRVQNIKLALYSTPWKAIQHLSRQRHRKGHKIYQDVFPALCTTEKLIRNLGLCWWMTFTDHILLNWLFPGLLPPFKFTYCKRSKSGGGSGLGMYSLPTGSVFQKQGYRVSLNPRLSWNANIYRTESLVSFVRKHDVIKIGPKQKGNVCTLFNQLRFNARYVCYSMPDR